MDHGQENERQRAIGSAQGTDCRSHAERTRFNDLHELQPSLLLRKQRCQPRFLLAEQRLHVVRDLSMKGRSHMAIGIKGQGNRAVAKQLLNHLGMNAPAQQVSRCGVPEVVDPDDW